MIKITKTLVATALIASFFTFQASAELVHTDWENTGDRKATLDTETGLEWLDLKETLGQNYENVLADTRYEGWRMPTTDEVITLMYHTFPNLNFGKTESEARNGANIDFLTPGAAAFDHYRGFFGTTYGSYSRGYYTDGNTGYRVDVSWTSGGDSGIKINISQGQLFNPTRYSDYQVGMFMVSDGGTTLSSREDPSLNANNSAAPINNVSIETPVSLALIGFGLMGLSFRRRQWQK